MTYVPSLQDASEALLHDMKSNSEGGDGDIAKAIARSITRNATARKDAKSCELDSFTRASWWASRQRAPSAEGPQFVQNELTLVGADRDWEACLSRRRVDHQAPFGAERRLPRP